MRSAVRLVPALAALLFVARPADTRTSETLLSAPDRWARLGDVTLRYRVIGQGQPIALLHGYTDSLEMWRGTADSLARSHRVIVPDLRGFGRSSKFDDPESYAPEMVDDVARLLDHLGYGDAHVVGYSMGAMVASQLAVRHADRLLSLTLVGGPLFPDSAASARMFEPLAERTERGEGVRGLMRWMFPTWSDSAIGQLDRDILASHDLGSLVASVRAFPTLAIPSSTPVKGRFATLAIVGTADPLLEFSRAFVRWWPEARLVEIPAADHATILEHPGLVAGIRSVVSRGTRDSDRGGRRGSRPGR
jgi:pimeloyl-ACP methyl ester carboxylesterase